MKKYLLLIFALVFFANSTSVYFNINQSFEEAEDLVANNETEEATELLDKIIEKKPNHVGAYVNRGLNNKNKDDYKQAVSDFERAIKLDNKNTKAYYQIGLILKDQKKYEESLKYFVLAENSIQNKNYTSTKLPLKRTFLQVTSPFIIEKSEISYQKAEVLFKLNKNDLALEELKNANLLDSIRSKSIILENARN